MRTWRLGRLGVGFLFQRSPAMRISEKDAELRSWINMDQRFSRAKTMMFSGGIPPAFPGKPKGPKSGRFRWHLYQFVIIYRGTWGLPLFFQPASWKRSSMVLAHLLRREVGSSVFGYVSNLGEIDTLLLEVAQNQQFALSWNFDAYTFNWGWVMNWNLPHSPYFCTCLHGRFMWHDSFWDKPISSRRNSIFRHPESPPKIILGTYLGPQTSMICSLSNVFVPPNLWFSPILPVGFPRLPPSMAVKMAQGP